MPLRKHEPVSENLMFRSHGKNTICQVLRDTYWMVEGEDARENIRIAMSMAKSMTNKLRGYKKDWDHDFWEKRTGEEIKEGIDRAVNTFWSGTGRAGDIKAAIEHVKQIGKK